MRIGWLGGSFNPPHLGHLALVRAVLDLSLVDAVRLVPAAMPPHKRISGGVDARLRLAMAELLSGEDERLAVDARELDRSGPSYTIDTLRQIAADHPGDSHRLIIGSDMAKTFATWREYRAILQLAPPLVAERPDDAFLGEDDFPGMSGDEAEILRRGRFPMRPVDISSTKVRNLIASGAADAEILRRVTRPILNFIHAHRLYRNHLDS